MAKVMKFEAPISVTFEGQALTTVARLSDVAVRLHSLRAAITPDIEEDFDEALQMLDDVVEMMTAVDESLAAIEQSAEIIANNIPDGELVSFVNKGTSIYYVGGNIARRNRVLNIVLFGLSKTLPFANSNIQGLTVYKTRGLLAKLHKKRKIVA